MIGMNCRNASGTRFIACCKSSSVGAAATIPRMPASLFANIAGSHSNVNLLSVLQFFLQ